MNLIALTTLTLLSASQNQVQPERAVPAIDIHHPGDQRAYLEYPRKAMSFGVKAPLTVEIAVRVLLPERRKRVKLRLKLKAGRQILLDQSQVLGRDRRAKDLRLTRPLVAIADIPDGVTRLHLEVSAPQSRELTFAVAMTQVELELAEATRSELADDIMVPDLVAVDTPAPGPQQTVTTETTARSPSSAPTQGATPRPAVHDVAPQPVSRSLGLELTLVQGLELPSLDMGARYYLPFWEQRISLGLRAGYGFVRRWATVAPLQNRMNVSLDVHLIPVLLLAEIELLRLDATGQILSLGLRLDGGLLPFVGELREHSVLASGEALVSSAPFSGLTWIAGAVLSAGLSLGPGQITSEIGYHYSPGLQTHTEAAAASTQRRRVEAQVLGFRMGLGYRLDI